MYISVLFSHCNCGPMLHLLFKTFANDSYLNAFYVRNAKSFYFLSILKKQMYHPSNYKDQLRQLKP